MKYHLHEAEMAGVLLTGRTRNRILKYEFPNILCFSRTTTEANRTGNPLSLWAPISLRSKREMRGTERGRLLHL